jgi:hypothetical protein
MKWLIDCIKAIVFSRSPDARLIKAETRRQRAEGIIHPKSALITPFLAKVEWHLVKAMRFQFNQ